MNNSRKKTKKEVHFNDDIQVIYEPPELSDLLKEARMIPIDHISRQLDKLRMEHLLTPIFDKQHRIKIQQRNKLSSV